MGRATILSGGDAGLYTVRVDYGTAQRDAAVAKVTARIAELTTTLAGLQATLDAYIAEEETPAAAAVNTAIDEYVTASRADPLDDAVLKAKLAAHQVAVRALFDIRQRAALLRIRVKEVKSEKIAAAKDSAKWAGLVLEEDRPAWCIDYTTDGAGEVATIDIPGESDAILIRAGAPAPAAGDGALIAREVQTGPQVFFNAAILPGWQKFKPLHRVGIITSIDNGTNTVGVSLVAAESSAQALDINQASTLSNVPVQYMLCNSAAFTENDRVVVEFTGQDWEQPKVIGFESEPRPCQAIYVLGNYLQFVIDTEIVIVWGFTALINTLTLERLETWVIEGANDPNGIMSYNGQPHYEIFGFSTLFDATGSGGHHGISPPALSICQHGSSLYGINAEHPRQVIIEFAGGPSLTETGRWQAVSGSGSLNSLSAHGGQVVVGGFLGAAGYGVRVFNIGSRTIAAEFGGMGTVESVDLSRDYLAVLHGLDGTGQTVNLYRRNPYVLLTSYALPFSMFSICVVGNRLVVETAGDMDVYNINPETGAITFASNMRPFDDLVAARPGRGSSTLRYAGAAGHYVCAVAKG